jgi:LmbE family N-acetylglucosaminyl deacetylase
MKQKSPVAWRRFGSAVLAAFLSALVVGHVPANAQLAPVAQDLGASGLGLALRRLPITARVLMVTAHPDDESGGVLVRLERGLGVRTALLTLTRGEGGQNEIGPELNEELGVLRTGELAAVHRLDGVEQFFGRSYEFGFSFSVDETLEKWGREEALSDVVRVIRAFRPDVILTLPLEGPGGGQHHQASALLAKEAFRAAADPARFPEQVRRGLLPWQARKIYQGGAGEMSVAGAVVVRTGTFDPLLGQSWNELGSLARASHRCQGANQLKVDPLSGQASYSLVDSEPPMGGVESDILDGIDVSLARLASFAPTGDARLAFLPADVDALSVQIDAALAAFDPRALDKAAPPIAAALDLARKLRTKIQKSPLPEAARFEIVNRLIQKEVDLGNALALAVGLNLSASSDDDAVVPGQTFTASVLVANQGTSLMRVDEVSVNVPDGWKAKRIEGDPKSIEAGKSLLVRFQVKVAEKGVRFSQPYWRRSLPSSYRYDLDVPAYEGLPWAPPDVTVTLRYTAAGGVSSSAETPVVWRYEGPWVGGEKQKAVVAVPLLSVQLAPEITVFPLSARGTRREFRVSVTNEGKEPVLGSVRLEAPQGWVVEPAQAPFAFRSEDEETTVRFLVTPPPGAAEGESQLRAVAVTRDGEFRDGFETIAYDHIEERHVYRPATARVKALDVKVPVGVSVGYIMGAGDEVANAIFQLGIPVTFVTETGLATGDLSRYSTIVTGIRAYQTRKDLRTYHQRLMKFVEEGGNLIVQYNKLDFNQLVEAPSSTSGFTGSQATRADSPWAPYPGLSVTTNRVTDENAPVTLLVPDHPFFTTPNRLTQRDWDGWVQERGTYFLDVRDARYTDLLASTDPFPNNAGEKRGILVEAKVGKGTWTYVGLGLFRQVTAGTEGIYPILANLVARPRAR